MSGAALDGVCIMPSDVSGPRFLPVLDDTLAPALRPGDFVAVLPVDGYRGTGCYAVRSAAGTVEFVMVQGAGLSGVVHVGRRNPAYGPGGMIALDAFADVVLGKVAAECRVTDPALLREASRRCRAPGDKSGANGGGIFP